MSKVRVAIAALTLSTAGFFALTGSEGFRSKAYLDQVGVPTIGYGTTRDVKLGDTITEFEARQRAMKEIKQDYESPMKKCVTVDLYQHYIGACTEVLKWNKAGGKVNKGLQNRREREYRMCLGDPYGINP
jgi:lysozyme